MFDGSVRDNPAITKKKKVSKTISVSLHDEEAS